MNQPIITKCISRETDKQGNIIRYLLIDKNNQQRIFDANQLKQLIASKQIEVVNLTLTSDNRLITKQPNTNQNSNQTKTQDRFIVRTHKISIKRSSNKALFNKLDKACFASKNLYNRALYLELQIYNAANNNAFTSVFLDRNELYRLLKEEDCFKKLNNIQPGLPQQTLSLVDKTIQSFRNSIRAYTNNPEKFLGTPRFPKFLNKKHGRQILDMTYRRFKIENNKLLFKLNQEIISIDIPNSLKGIQVRPRAITSKNMNNYPTFTLDQVRVVPKHKSYDIELVYSKKIQVPISTKQNIASIDLGMENIASLVFIQSNINPILISGKYLKSYNKFFNKRLANIVSKIDKAKNEKNYKVYHRYLNQKLKLIQKRNNYFNTNIHQIASYIVKQLLKTHTTKLVIGYNEGWKQYSKLSKKINQTFIQLPLYKLVKTLEYKCYEHNITVFRPEESYTSSTSFLDQELPIIQNYNRKRRRHRGIFKSNNHKLINADVNGSLQILKKVSPALNNVPPDAISYQHPRKVIIPKMFKRNHLKTA